MMRKYFFAGLALLLPTTITLIVTLFIVNLVTRPFEGAVESVLTYYNLFDKPFLFLSAYQVLNLISKTLVIAFIILLIFLIGMMGQNIITRAFFNLGDYVIHKIPLVNKVYKATTEVVHNLFKTDSTAFSQVVLVPFPHANAYSIGLISTEQNLSLTENKISIFVPGTPNPTMGFMLMFNKNEVIPTDMKVDEALKFVISCGIMSSGKLQNP